MQNFFPLIETPILYEFLEWREMEIWKLPNGAPDLSSGRVHSYKPVLIT